MDNKEEFYIPRYLDEPERWLFWTIDEAMVLLLPIIVALNAGYLMLGMVVSGLSYVAWMKLKRNGHINTVRFAIYWFYPSTIMRLKHTPPSNIIFYLG